MRRTSWRFRYEVMNSMNCIAIVIAFLLQVNPALPRTLGDIAQQLTPEDIATVERVLPAGSGMSWMIFGIHRGGGRDSFDVYLAPTTDTADLRRGTLARFFWSPALRRPTIDNVAPTMSSYAQVAVTGRNFDVQKVTDLNRPFEVIGSIDDGDLRSIVALLRSMPSAPTGNRVVPASPILSITRNSGDDGVIVRLDPETQPRPGGIARILLGKANGVWFVSQIVIGQA
jgi:hypothetical protein